MNKGIFTKKIPFLGVIAELKKFISPNYTFKLHFYYVTEKQLVNFVKLNTKI